MVFPENIGNSSETLSSFGTSKPLPAAPSKALSRIKMKAEQLGDELAKAGGIRRT